MQMSSTSSLIAATSIACLLMPAARTQNHLLVPSQFPEIGLAIQSANPGDIIEVEERFPRYQPFVIDRPITIVGRAGEHRAPTVLVFAGVGIDIQLAPGERATLSRIDVQSDATAVATGGMRIQGGAVTLEDCRIVSGNDPSGQAAAVEATDTELNVTFCRFAGGAGGTGLLANNSFISLTDSRCGGGSMPSGAGLELRDSVLHATEGWLLGGDELLAAPGGDALRVLGNSLATLHESTAVGGSGQPAGSGLVNMTNEPVEHSVDTFAGGMSFPSLTFAPDIVGPATSNPNLVGLRWSEPPYRNGTLQPGLPWAANVYASPNVLGAVAFSFGPSGLAALITRQAALLPGDIVLISAMVTGVTGFGTFSGTLPNDPGLRGATLWAQAMAGTSFPMEASPPSAVVVR